MKKHFTFKFACILIIILTSCAPARFVKPLEKDEIEVGAHLGGAMISFAGLPIPMPLSSLNIGYGLNDRITLHGAVHTTALMFQNIQLETGAGLLLREQQESLPGISLSVTANTVWHPSSAELKLWPQADLGFFREYGQKNNYFYTGISNWFELSARRAHEEEQVQHWIPSPFIGHVFDGEKWNFLIELKYINPLVSNEKIVVDYISPAKTGAIGLYFGVSRKLNF